MVRLGAVVCIISGLSAFTPALAAAQQPVGPGAPKPAAAPIDYATAHLERRLNAIKTTTPINLDGRLDEPAWSGAPLATHFIQNDPREGEPATYETEVRVLYDDAALYFGVFAKD